MAKYGPQVRPVNDRFWSHVRMDGDCWEWTAARTPLGYGVAVAENRRITKAHRLSWELAVGAIPPGLYVLHLCDNPPCVRPSHLALGTQATNMADASRKGRTASGSRNGSVTSPESYPWKIGRARALEIRARATGRRGEAVTLATEYGVSPEAIRAILRGDSY